jgi:hypothetical protein
MWSPEQLTSSCPWTSTVGAPASSRGNPIRSSKITIDPTRPLQILIQYSANTKFREKTGVFLLCFLTDDTRPGVVPSLMLYFNMKFEVFTEKNSYCYSLTYRAMCRDSRLLWRWRQYTPPKPDRLHGVITHSTYWTLGCIWPRIAHLRHESHNSKFVIFQEKLSNVLKCYNFQWVQRRHNCSPAASFANCVMSLYLLTVHLQTFLSIPITQ